MIACQLSIGNITARIRTLRTDHRNAKPNTSRITTLFQENEDYEDCEEPVVVVVSTMVVVVS